jgi:FkbM family methyltransferase
MAANLAARYPEVDVRAVALADTEGTVTFYEPTDFPGWGSTQPGRSLPSATTLEELTVDARRLDDDLPPNYAPAFIKIDTEGSEEQVLAGALRTIRDHKPLVVFEHGGSLGDSPDPNVSRRIHQSLTECGLRLFDIDGRGPLTVDDFLRTVARQKIWNFLARA